MYFAAFACATALGNTAKMTLAAVDAGLSGADESDFMCATGRPAVTCTMDDMLLATSSLAEDMLIGNPSNTEIRLSQLSAFGLLDLRQQVPQLHNIALIWNQPEMEAGKSQLAMKNMATLCRALEFTVLPDLSTTTALGRAGGIDALQRSQALFAGGYCDYVLIGGADNATEATWLSQLDQQGRLKHEGAFDSFIPGEGAAFLLLARTPELARTCTQQASAHANPPIQFSASADSHSSSHWYSPARHKGEALAQCITLLEKQLHTSAPWDGIVCSLNGEQYWMKEHAIAISRHAARLSNATLHHPFECTGDLGAASGAFLLGYSAHLLHTQRHNTILAYSSADNSWRTACSVKTLPNAAL